MGSGLPSKLVPKPLKERSSTTLGFCGWGEVWGTDQRSGFQLWCPPVPAAGSSGCCWAAAAAPASCSSCTGLPRQLPPPPSCARRTSRRPATRRSRRPTGGPAGRRCRLHTDRRTCKPKRAGGNGAASRGCGRVQVAEPHSSLRSCLKRQGRPFPALAPAARLLWPGAGRKRGRHGGAAAGPHRYSGRSL